MSKKSYNDGLYASGNLAGYYAPTGGAFSSDVTKWKMLTDRGEPERRDVLAVGRELTGYHSFAGVGGGTSAPMLIQNGWTDDLFPVPEGLRAYNTLQLAGSYAALQVGDFGHPRGQNKQAVDRVLQDQGARFFAAFLKRRGQAAQRRQRRCLHADLPRDAPAAGPLPRAQLGSPPPAQPEDRGPRRADASGRVAAIPPWRPRSTRSAARERARRSPPRVPPAQRSSSGT